jgi:Protein of unknown function (DUF1656)
MVVRSQLVGLLAGAVNRPELRFSEVLVPWIMIVGALGFLTAWLVVTIMEHTGLSRYVWHLPLFFVGLVVLLSSLIGMMCSP